MRISCYSKHKEMRKTITLVAIISLSIQLLNASCAGDGLVWSERIFNKNFCSAIFTCKVLDNIFVKEEKKDEFGKIYTENEGYRISVQVEKVFFGEVDTGMVNISNRMAMEPQKT